MKILKKITAFALGAALCLSAVGCGGGNGDSSGGNGKIEMGKRGEEGTLSLNVYAAGYGTDWITSAVTLFIEDNPNVKYYLEASPLALSAVKTQLENGNCKDDVILVNAADYESYVAKGYIEDLSDVYAHAHRTHTTHRRKLKPLYRSPTMMNSFATFRDVT